MDTKTYVNKHKPKVICRNFCCGTLLKRRKTKIQDFPALMIGRLATDNNYRGRHVGENICLWCLSKVKQLSAQVGFKLIIILTNDKKQTFYLNCGFDMVPKFEKKAKKWMYLPVP